MFEEEEEDYDDDVKEYSSSEFLGCVKVEENGSTTCSVV